MKKKIFSAIASLSVAVWAHAQGVFFLDNEVAPEGGFAVDSPGNWYSGTFGMEVWMLNSVNIPAGINLSEAPGSGVLGYSNMTAAGFVREKTYAGQTTPYPGDFSIGQVRMPDVTPAGATVVVALAAWNSSDPTWSAMLANANQATRAGIIASVQPTSDFLILPYLAPDLGMTQDLVMEAIPEPSGLPLAGLGGMLLLFFHHRPQTQGASRRRHP